MNRISFSQLLPESSSARRKQRVRIGATLSPSHRDVLLPLIAASSLTIHFIPIQISLASCMFPQRHFSIPRLLREPLCRSRLFLFCSLTNACFQQLQRTAQHISCFLHMPKRAVTLCHGVSGSYGHRQSGNTYNVITIDLQGAGGAQARPKGPRPYLVNIEVAGKNTYRVSVL